MVSQWIRDACFPGSFTGEMARLGAKRTSHTAKDRTMVNFQTQIVIACVVRTRQVSINESKNSQTHRLDSNIRRIDRSKLHRGRNIRHEYDDDH